MENQHTPSNLWISEAFVDLSREIRFGETGPYESFTDDPSRLYRSCQREYGRCTGKVYIDKKDGQSVAIGWVFLGRDKYQDCNKTYLREVWVTLHDGRVLAARLHDFIQGSLISSAVWRTANEINGTIPISGLQWSTGKASAAA